MQGYNRDVATDIKVTRINWKERSLFFQQLQGEHVIILKKICLSTGPIPFLKLFRQEPDRRGFRYDLEEATNIWYLSDRPEEIRFCTQDLLDETDRTLMFKKGLYLGEHRST